MDDKSKMEDIIIRATISCIEQNGMQGTTIRKIAEYANLNSAAINYYFRSKDRLIEQAMATALDNGFDWNDYEPDASLGVHARVESVLFRMVKGAQTFPGLTRAYFNAALCETGGTGQVTVQFNGFLEKLLQNIRPLIPEYEERELRTALVQLMAATFFLPALMPHMFDGFGQRDLTNNDELKAYIHRLVQRLL